MRPLDREGIFKARLVSWKIRDTESGAVAVSCEFHVLSQWDGVDWADWSEYDEHRCFGDWWVVKKSGQINTGAVEQLTRSLWVGAAIFKAFWARRRSAPCRSRSRPMSTTGRPVSSPT